MAKCQKARNQHSDKRPIRIEGDVAYVPLTKGYEAVIDAADVPLVEDASWCAKIARNGDGSIRTVYAEKGFAGIGGRIIMTLMHRMLIGAPKSSMVDHVNGNGLDNRRLNLRLATSSENAHNRRINRNNTSGLKGVCFDKSAGKWRAMIRLDGKLRHLGFFMDIEEAHAAYVSASLRLHGPFSQFAAKPA